MEDEEKCQKAANSKGDVPGIAWRSPWLLAPPSLGPRWAAAHTPNPCPQQCELLGSVVSLRLGKVRLSFWASVIRWGSCLPFRITQVNSTNTERWLNYWAASKNYKYNHLIKRELLFACFSEHGEHSKDLLPLISISQPSAQHLTRHREAKTHCLFLPGSER